MMGIACIILGFFVSFSPLLFLLFAMILILFVAIFFIDFTHRIIPDILLLLLIVVITIVHSVTGENIGYSLLSGVGGLTFFCLLFIVTKGRGIGFGDVKFAGVIGYMLGYPETVVALYSAFLTGAAISVILVVVGKKKFKGGSIAFGPFLIAGVLIALLWTNEILALLF
jgi:leader peptidase (prepilin peptidase)/N-methyltransferase